MFDTVVRAFLLVAGLVWSGVAAMMLRLAARDWPKLMAAPPIVRLWGLGFLAGAFLVIGGLFLASAAFPHEAKPLLLAAGLFLLLRGLGMRFTARRISETGLFNDE